MVLGVAKPAAAVVLLRSAYRFQPHLAELDGSLPSGARSPLLLR